MLLAAILLLFPVPQNGNTARAAVSPSIDISSDVSSNPGNDSSSSETLPAAPEPKVKTDAELAAGSDAGAGSPMAAASPAAAILPGTPAIQPGSSRAPILAVKPMTAPTGETAGQRKLWYALSITGSGAAAFDAWSTRRAITQGYGVEGNPMLRPFAHSGVLYAATQVSPLVMDYIGKRMMRSRSALMRKIWWVPQSAGSGVSLWAGVHNVRLVP
jgi:hypothetical protein